MSSFRQKSAYLSAALIVSLSLFSARGLSAANPTVTLSSATIPSTAEPGVSTVYLQGSGFPTGTIVPANIQVSLSPTNGVGPSATVPASAIQTIIGTTRRVAFVVPTSIALASPTPYQAAILDVTDGFQSNNAASLTVNPAATLTSVSPLAAMRGQTVTVTLNGSYTNFVSGGTQVSAGAGITPSSVVVNSSSSLTVQFTISPTAATGPVPLITATTGLEVASIANAFTIQAAAPAAITVVSGSAQSASINTSFTAPLVVKVTDASNNPVSGVTVTFAVPGTGASGTFAGGVNTATTNASGVATSAVFTANSTAGGPYSITASVSGVSTPATFSLTNTVGSASSIAVVSGTPQSAKISTAFAAPLVALVKDSGGNPVSGVTVTFGAPGTGASGTFAGGVNTATTNSSGIATSAVFTANSTAGSYSVSASASGVSTPATFSLTNNVGPASSIAVVSGTPQSARISTAFAAPLVAVVKDSGASNNPVSGVTVTFGAPGTGASGTFAGGVNTATTNASGIATSATFTANTTIGGPYNVTASVSGVGTPATFALTNTVGPANSITVVSGTPQSAQISTAFAAPLVAVVKDAGGNPVSGVTVTFTAPGSGASGTFAGGVNTATTNASGIATSATFTANSTVGGPYSVTASVSGVGTPATFALTNTTGPAGSITVVSGTPQSATISTAFAAPLVAVVKDAGGNPVSGVTVTFAAPGTGASGTFAGGVNTATTNSSGIATSAVFTANSTAGSYSVSASASGVSTPATFSLTNNVGPASSIAVVSGTPQSARISTAFAAPLVAVVKDSGGNPVSGVTVTFGAPGTGASGTFAGGVNTATTNASGIATSATFTANTTSGGPYNVTASVSGVGTPATFALTNTVGPANSITVVSGTPQSAQISTAFAAPLVAVVKDAGGNPVSGVTVTFTAPGSGASGTFAGGVNTATTNASGIATSATFTANSTVGGPYSVTASVSGVGTPATFALTNTTGPAGSITVVSGTPQSATISTAFAAPLVAVVKDAGGNPVSGVTVTFAAPGTGASGTFAGGVNTATTNASGIATSAVFTANSTAGSYSVSASASGVSTPATFSLTNNVGPASSIAVVSGTPQSARISTAFAAPLVAVVKDAGGNPVSGVTVTFAAPGTGASGSFAGGVNTATTNASGIATSATFTANTTIGGPYNVTASVSGVGTPATFALTNTVGPASSIAVVSGTPQSAQISTAFAEPRWRS